MSAAGSAPRREGAGDTMEQRVAPLELFFDLVFVFAVTQVTGLLSDDPTWMGLLRGMALLGALWWAWVCYSWLTNSVRAEEETLARLVVLSAMAAMLIASLAIPGAFDEDGVLFGVTYFVVRLLHLALYTLSAGSEDRETRQTVLRFAPGFVGPLRCSSSPGSSTARLRGLSGRWPSRSTTARRSSGASPG